MPEALTIADFIGSVDCELKKIATLGEPRSDWYVCKRCGGRELVKAGGKKPECLVTSLQKTQRSP